MLHKKFIGFLTGFLFLLCIIFYGTVFSAPPPVSSYQDETVTITGVGDIMLGSHYPSADYLPPDDGKNLLNGMKPFLENSDIVMGNLEGPLLDKGECYKLCEDPKLCFAFKMPEHYVHHLVAAGFNLINIANNHINDFGPAGKESTVKTLKKAGLHFAGLESFPYEIFEINGIKYGFCAFAPNSGTPDLRIIDKARKTVEQLESVCDIVIVSFHGGGEGGNYRHVTRKTEIFSGEDRGNVYEFSHSMIDSGADIVFGHGPHVTRAIELYKGRFIAYSLGNFCTYGRFNLRHHNGVAPVIRIKVNKNGEFISGRIIPIHQKSKASPAYDDQKRAIKDIIELTSVDFPDSCLDISVKGEITKKSSADMDTRALRE